MATVCVQDEVVLRVLNKSRKTNDQGTFLANFVNNEFVFTEETIDNIDPSTGNVVARIPRTKDVQPAVDAALAAKKSWGATTLAERITWIERIAEVLEARVDDLAALESKDTGKPMGLAKGLDATRSASNFRFFAKMGKEMKDQTFEMEDALNTVIRKPVGLVGLISPWNLPLYLLSWKVAPALLMGNCIIAKPSELTPMTATFLAEVALEIGLPKGVLNIVHGLGAEIGHALVSHPQVPAISFTGGTSTGKIVAATAAPMFKKLSLELGGKNATIILDDADVEAIVPSIVRASFLNSGQICLCGSRIFIADTVYDKFITLFVEAVSKMTVGDPATANMGSLISYDHRDKVESYVEIAKNEGGEILTGGVRPELAGAFLRPTVIAGLSHKARAATEEIFGPVVTVHRFSSDEEALEMANCTNYGLAGSVWTGDNQRGFEFAKQVETGIIWVNTWLHRDLRTPFGGVKSSGVGREGGDWSLNFFCELMNICVKHK